MHGVLESQEQMVNDRRRSTSDVNEPHNTQLSGENAEDQNVFTFWAQVLRPSNRRERLQLHVMCVSMPSERLILTFHQYFESYF